MPRGYFRSASFASCSSFAVPSRFSLRFRGKDSCQLCSSQTPTTDRFVRVLDKCCQGSVPTLLNCIAHAVCLVVSCFFVTVHQENTSVEEWQIFILGQPFYEGGMGVAFSNYLHHCTIIQSGSSQPTNRNERAFFLGRGEVRRRKRERERTGVCTIIRWRKNKTAAIRD